MLPRLKRSAEVINLTGDTLPEHAAKRPAYSSPQSSRFASATGNLPSSSQLSVHEPDAFDLTQVDDGPQRELYATFGL